MHGLKIGHNSNHDAGTGVSVFLFEKSALACYQICGSAPASHELAVMDPEVGTPEVHGLMLAGGSAYGLFAAQGIMRYLTERGIGHATPHGVVPIVPAAAVYDLIYKKAIPPTSEDAYQACLTARENNKDSGRIGAGTGATVGKIVPGTKRMTSGLGRAELSLANGLHVIAYAVVNAVGDVRNAQGQIVAGARDAQGGFADCEKYLLSGQAEEDLFPLNHTTLAVVITNARFQKAELKRIAKMAVAGMARAISPIFTRYDGDIIFCISNGGLTVSELTTGTLAAEAVRLAILDAVKDSEIIS